MSSQPLIDFVTRISVHPNVIVYIRWLHTGPKESKVPPTMAFWSLDMAWSLHCKSMGYLNLIYCLADDNRKSDHVEKVIEHLSSTSCTFEASLNTNAEG